MEKSFRDILTKICFERVDKENILEAKKDFNGMYIVKNAQKIHRKCTKN